ncbi:carbohydrate ABC transporter permease [Candidatus Nitrosocosmicus agrestis]|jgi:ABC-type glycerol-3-phosphate transport system permease component|uniref:carbohydrate ABC transporter permease n=1 Tax=Candidatus Nitrosocosmicus agrestis TaxID=2563600 RepID=UPI00122DE9EC|nr:carbohydrate ABC transporter permease [Candidatus Nitrosocosmicus sp. SS]KAA2280357.1 carbohydrate ABC transporter permease [Candidatus Nitrosocosmicus sp. SS]KAF0868033.1 carbohydrate ABC transporter permease [Candidatus Nitrosocosmicus sp. SS]MDR4491533.1 carbohydrate ABC transporter permease [Candidatus Nitrosocosmicus sp.]
MPVSTNRIDKIEKSIIYIVLFVFIGLTMFPLIWVFTTSLKPNDESMSFPPKLIPEKVTLENYFFVMTNSTIVKSLYNSLIVSVGSMILNVSICALAGYGLARFEFRAKSILLYVILALFTIPIIVNIIPLYSILANLNMLNSLLSLILTFQILIIPLNVVLLKNYFETIPKEVEESALIDGCSKFGVLRRIIIPLSLPGLAVAAIFSFIFSWNEFVLPIVLANSPDSTLFQVALYQFISIYRIEWGYLSAGIVVALVPVIILIIAFQRQMIKGFTLGSLRG